MTKLDTTGCRMGSAEIWICNLNKRLGKDFVSICMQTRVRFNQIALSSANVARSLTHRRYLCYSEFRELL